MFLFTYFVFDLFEITNKKETHQECILFKIASQNS